MTGQAGKWQHIANYYRELISNGSLVAGDAMDSHRQIAQDWGVSIGTVAKAMNSLANDGLLLTRERGKTLVAARSSFAIALPRADLRIIDAGITVALPDTARQLGIEPGSNVLVLRIATSLGQG